MSAMRKMVAGAVDYIRGKLQRAIGQRTGNRKLQAKGYVSQGKGAAKYGSGKAEKAVDDLKKS